MGWASGSDLFDKIIEVMKEAVPDVEARVAAYRKLVDAFRDADWDTLDECLDKDEAYDRVFREIYPDEDE